MIPTTYRPDCALDFVPRALALLREIAAAERFDIPKT